MKITNITTAPLYAPLRKPFKTAVRTATHINDIMIQIETDEGVTGIGAVPPSEKVSGDTNEGDVALITQMLKPQLVGMDVADKDTILRTVQHAFVHNTGAKAGVDIAVHDLYGKFLGLPLYRILGGDSNQIETDLTISVNDVPTMVADSLEAVERGYRILKLKVGKDVSTDLRRIKEIRAAVGHDVKIRIDANQGWTPKEAVRIIAKMEDMGLDIELIEQPVAQYDLDGLRYVTQNSLTDIMADEAVFSYRDANTVITTHAADLINIKLMKTGGIWNAMKIASLAEEYGVKCMIGCMLEGSIGIIAAAHFGASQPIVTFADLDGIGLASYNPVVGGVKEQGGLLLLDPLAPGLGIKEIIPMK